jgi:phosphoglycerol transferase MdoB-like AlkP superfamily enzyme
MRTEFAVLTGIPETALGYDRFNPYYGLARVPIQSQVWRLRRAGYRTICLHPFDRRFFRRDLAMPALGFEQFLGRESLGGGRRPPYQSDPELAGHILRTLDAEGPRTLIFAITMGNHGPWLPAGPAIDPAVAELFDAAAIRGGAGLLRYLDGLRRSDEMLQILLDGLKRRGRPVVLGFYGDHLPSLGNAFAHFGFAETSSDYAVWWPGAVSQRRDIPSHELGRIIVDGVLDAAEPAAPGACLTQSAPASSPR